MSTFKPAELTIKDKVKLISASVSKKILSRYLKISRNEVGLTFKSKSKPEFMGAYYARFVLILVIRKKCVCS